MLAVQHYELEQQIETSGAYTVSSVEDIDAMSSSVHSSDDEFYECDVNEEGMWVVSMNLNIYFKSLVFPKILDHSSWRERSQGILDVIVFVCGFWNPNQQTKKEKITLISKALKQWLEQELILG